MNSDAIAQTIRITWGDTLNRVGLDAHETLQQGVTPPATTNHINPPTRLVGSGHDDDFMLLEELGAGGMGVVHAAQQRSLGRSVALKTLHAGSGETADAEAAFLMEAAVLADLEHPNIVPIIDAGRTTSGAPFYAMKQVEGLPWDAFFNQSPSRNRSEASSAGMASPEPETVRFARRSFSLHEHVEVLLKVCDAIAFAHSRGVLHRDLKPANVLIGPYGEVLVVDWGLAVAIPTADGRQSRAQPLARAQAAGTPAYMAPEMAIGNLAALGPASDIYLLGAILYQIISGHPPHQGNTLESVLTKASANNIQWTNDHPELQTIAQRALADQPHQRYDSVASFQADLRAWQRHGESIALTNRAVALAKSNANDVQTSSQAVFLLDQALDLWPGNLQAQDARARAQLSLAMAFIGNGALDEAAAIIDPDNPTHRNAHTRLLEAQTARDQSLVAHARLRDLEEQTDIRWQLLIDDDFTNETSPSRWQCLAPNYTCGNGAMSLSGARPSVVRSLIPVDGDVRIAFTASLHGHQLSDLSCFFAAYDHTDPTQLVETGYQVKLGAYSNTLNMVLRAGTRLAAQPASPLISGRSFRVLIERIGGALAVHLDDRLVAAVDDPEPLIGAGRTVFGLFTWDCQMTITRIRVETRYRARLERLVDVAERQLQHGRYATATDLFEDVLSGNPDDDERQLAQDGLRRLTRRAFLDDALIRLRAALDATYPGASVVAEGDGLTVDLSNQTVGDLSILNDMPVVHLRLINTGLRNLAGLTGMRIKRLYINQNYISDISPLAGMPLTELNASQNTISDLTPLRGTPLRRLNIGYNRITDLTPINPRAIEFLSIEGNPIGDLTPIAGPCLSNLEASDTHITDLSALDGCPLVDVRVDRTAVSDLSPIASARMLSADHCPIESLVPLAGGPIVQLTVSSTQISSLEPLQTCLGLKMLAAMGTHITDLKPLANKQLSSLYIGHSAVTNIDALSTCRFLERLNIAGTQITDCTPIAECPIKTLNITNTPIQRLGPVAARLQTLEVQSENALDRIEDRNELSASCDIVTPNGRSSGGQRNEDAHLRHLFAQGQLIDGPGGIEANLSNQVVRGLGLLLNRPISKLNISNCDVSDLTMLKAVRREPLKYLAVGNNPLTSLTGIEHLRLQELDCRDCPISDVSQLRGMPLERIVLDHTAVTNLEPLSNCPLQYCSLVGLDGVDTSPLPDGCTVTFA